MKVITICVLLINLITFTQTIRLRNPQNHNQVPAGQYCDEWNKCPSGYYCVDKKCSLQTCANNDQCGDGFSCTNGRCISGQSAQPGRYCDDWTPCSSNQQCYYKKCVPSNCWENNNCAADFRCQNSKCVLGNRQNEGQSETNSQTDSQNHNGNDRQQQYWQGQTYPQNTQNTQNTQTTQQYQSQPNQNQDEQGLRLGQECNGFFDCPLGKNCKDYKCVPIINIDIGI